MYRNPALAVDAILEIPEGLVLIRRRNEPFKGMWALPGGFVDYGESVESAVAREVQEETGLIAKELRQFHVYSDPQRDPRQHIVSVVFAVKAVGTPQAHDDAADIGVFTWDRLPDELAFDHGCILNDYLNYSRSCADNG